jgi:hypothetical protein
MTKRFDTTNTAGESAEWQPAGEVLLQIAAADPESVVDVMGRVADDAPWALVTQLRPNVFDPFTRLAAIPNLKLVISHNTLNSSIKVWDQE